MPILDKVKGMHGTEGLVLPLCAKGSLFEYAAIMRLRNRGRKPFTLLSKFLCIFQQFLEGLAHLHAHGVVHHDLKEANILLDTDDRVVITDYGLSSMVGACLSSCRGTEAYMPPEMLSCHLQLKSTTYHAHPAQDMWSTGVTFFSLFSSNPIPRQEVRIPGFDAMNEEDKNDAKCLYHLDNSEVYSDLLDRAVKHVAPHFAEEDEHERALLAMLQECLQVDPQLRPTAASLAPRVRALLQKVLEAEQVRSLAQCC
jgi:serine/threonine protein kinase